MLGNVKLFLKRLIWLIVFFMLHKAHTFSMHAITTVFSLQRSQLTRNTMDKDDDQHTIYMTGNGKAFIVYSFLFFSSVMATHTHFFFRLVINELFESSG